MCGFENQREFFLVNDSPCQKPSEKLAGKKAAFLTQVSNVPDYRNDPAWEELSASKHREGDTFSRSW